ncbi:hypothetical protein F3Y22_tig00112505pilonHSYRG00022 [Hibiscus syriacus]|uniref:Uncharacterized protein n=1 Tax=Hibiscus syriacus TaxID=106335 RepID=A0A6A2XA43_HIBSY|nr:hypothetical protein F3Y22_tig00112505pilonHSYRG00022 [Hibiscus syriacus]
MFSSPEMAQDLTWHAQVRANNGMLSHPRDSPSWKLVDRTWKEFGEEKQNLRLALSADGPKQPGNNIDVYLAPLIADLKLLFDHQSERFILASQAKQVFYVQDQQDATLSVVSFTPHKMYMYGANGEIDDMLEYNATFDFSQDSPLVVLCTMESDQSLSHDEDSKQRGPTIKGKTTKGKVIVTDNKKGVLIDVEATKLASFEGMVARSMVSITYATWRDVEQEKKKTYGNTFWSRKNTLQSIGTKWKNFKHYLYKKFIEKFKNDPNANLLNPSEMYPYLKIDEWKEEMQKSETLGEVSCGTNDMLTQALDGEKKKIEKRFNQIEGAIEKLQKGMNHASEGASCKGWGKAYFEDNPPEEFLFTYITWEDFEVVFTVDEITGYAITCYMMYFFEEIKNGSKIDHGICFMSPSAISPSGRKAKFKNSDEAIRSVEDRLSLRKDNDIVLVPYNPGAMKLYSAQSGSNKSVPVSREVPSVDIMFVSS